MQKFSVKTEVCFGNGALEKLGEICADSAVIFTDGFMKKSGTADSVASYMKNCKTVSVFSEIKPDPPVETVAAALGFLLDKKAEVAVALGGGSSIDAAKSTVMIYERKTGKKIPLIAIPTTSGTGSEVTSFSVITDAEKGVKYPLVSDDLLPVTAILAPELTVSVPQTVTADTGFDVLTHAVEAYISTAANDFSDALAEKAVELTLEYLPKAYEAPSDLTAREKMHTASCLAGMAFNAVSLGVVHGIAHALGANFHIPHGRANAMMLPYVLEYNAGLSEGSEGTQENFVRVRARLARLAHLVGLDAYSEKYAAQSFIRRVYTMERSLGIPATLADAGVTKEAYAAAKAHIVESAVKDACTATNPVKMTPSGVETILARVDKF